MKGLNVAGYHLHFITNDRSGGGHLLSCETQDIMVSIDTTDQFTLYLPQTPPFLAADLTQMDKKELMQVEKDR